MNYRILSRYLAIITLLLAASMLLSIPWAYPALGGSQAFETNASLALASSVVIAIGISLLLAYFGRGATGALYRKEAMATVGLSWVLATLLGAIPFLLGHVQRGPNQPMTVADAIFESASGFTGTGATVITNLEDPSLVPRAILFWRSETHFLGGLGIMVLFVALLGQGSAGKALMLTEMPGPNKETGHASVQYAARVFTFIYLALNTVLTFILILQGMSLFDALCHSFGTLATGGFSTKNASIAAYSSATVDYIIIVFMIIAGTNFSLHYKLFTGKFSDFFKNPEFRFFISLIALATFIIFLEVLLFQYHEVGKSFQYSSFQVVSIMTTTGYCTADYEKWSITAQIILFMLMFIGGSAGSTGGGIKVIRLLLLVKFAYNELIRLLHPNAIVTVKISGQVIDRKVLINVAGFFIIYVMITAVSVLIVSSFGLDFATSMGAVAATINNIGPGLGGVGPTDNYAHLPSALKWFLSFLMMLGRLEIYTVIILLSPTFWKR